MDQFGNAYVVGRTASEDFPSTKGALQRRHAGNPSGGENQDLFVAKFILGPPKILSASVSGMKLSVFGGNFDDGAVILLNGAIQKTANDETEPAGELTAKKAGKLLPPGVPATLQVRNSDGALSNEFKFTK